MKFALRPIRGRGGWGGPHGPEPGGPSGGIGAPNAAPTKQHARMAFLWPAHTPHATSL